MRCYLERRCAKIHYEYIIHRFYCFEKIYVENYTFFMIYVENSVIFPPLLSAYTHRIDLYTLKELTR